MGDAAEAGGRERGRLPGGWMGVWALEGRAWEEGAEHPEGGSGVIILGTRAKETEQHSF